MKGRRAPVGLAVALVMGWAVPRAVAVDRVPNDGKLGSSVTGLWLPGIMYGSAGWTGLAFLQASLRNLSVAGVRTEISMTPSYTQYSIPFQLVDEPLQPVRGVQMQQSGVTLRWAWWFTERFRVDAGASLYEQHEWIDPLPFEKVRVARTLKGPFASSEADRHQVAPQFYVEAYWDNLDDEYGLVTGNPLEGWRFDLKVLAARRNGRRDGYTRGFLQLERFFRVAPRQTLVASFIGRWTDRTLPMYAMQMYGGADYFPNQALRGYILSYFWGDWLWNASAEWRFPLAGSGATRLGGVVFADSGGVGSYVASEHSGYQNGPFFGFGAGLRAFLADTIIVRLDFSVPRISAAAGPHDAPWNFVHLGLGQTF